MRACAARAYPHDVEQEVPGAAAGGPSAAAEA